MWALHSPDACDKNPKAVKTEDKNNNDKAGDYKKALGAMIDDQSDSDDES